MLTLHTPLSWRQYRMNKTYRAWDLLHPNTTTREKGVIPNCTPEAQPLNKDQKLMDKYSLSPHDPQWLFEALKCRDP